MPISYSRRGLSKRRGQLKSFLGRQAILPFRSAESIVSAMNMADTMCTFDSDFFVSRELADQLGMAPCEALPSRFVICFHSQKAGAMCVASQLHLRFVLRIICEYLYLLYTSLHISRGSEPGKRNSLWVSLPDDCP